MVHPTKHNIKTILIIKVKLFIVFQMSYYQNLIIHINFHLNLINKTILYSIIITVNQFIVFY